MMKNAILLYILLMAVSPSHAQWVQQVSNTTNDLWTIFFTSNTTGYVSSSLNLLNTTNGGVNWNPSFSTPCGSLQFLNTTDAFALYGSPDVI